MIGKRGAVRTTWLGVTTLGIGVAMALGGCTANGTSPPGDAASSQTLDVGETSAPVTLDPASDPATDDQFDYLIYARLIDFNQKTGALEPGLATSWAFSGPNHLIFTLKLRPHVKFQDGTPLNAAAVVFSLRRYISLGIEADLKPVSSVTATGPLTVRLKLSSQYSALPGVLADKAGMIVSPTAVRKYGAKFAAHPVGAGPYEFASEVSGYSLDLKRFSGYYAGRPPVAGIDWTFYPSTQAEESAARSGQLDMAFQIPDTDASAIRNTPGMSVNVAGSYNYTLVHLTATVSPLNSALVREAINDAVNRKQFVSVQGGTGAKQAWETFPAQSPYFDAKIAPTYTYNPTKAKQLLAKAGYPKGFPLSCLNVTGNIDNWNTASTLFAQQMAAIGITVKILTESGPQVVADWESGHVPCYLSEYPGRLQPALTLQLDYAINGQYNIGHADYGVQKLIEQLDQTYQAGDQVKVIHRIDAALVAAAPQVPLVNLPAVSLVSKNLGGFVPSFLGVDDISTVYFKAAK